MLRRKELLMIVLAQVLITLVLTSAKPHYAVNEEISRHSLLNESRIYLP